MRQRQLAVAAALLAAVLIACPVGADVYDSRGDQYDDAGTMKEDYEVTHKKGGLNSHEVVKTHLDNPVATRHPANFAADAEDVWTQSEDPWLKNQAKLSGPMKGDANYKAGASSFDKAIKTNKKISAIRAYKAAAKDWADAKTSYLRVAGKNCRRANRCSPSCKQYETYRKYHRKKVFKWTTKKFYKWHNKKFYKWHTVRGYKSVDHWRSHAPKCKTLKKFSSNAGIVRVPQSKGYTMVGGGVSNRYRKFDKLSAFEENYPEGTNWRCDSGFGPGKLHCYSRQCKISLSCTNRSSFKNGRGIAIAQLPAGYVATSGGVVNHHRQWGPKIAFEKTMPRGLRAWQCDIGLGGGKFTCYVRGCKSTATQRLSCFTRKTHDSGNWHDVQCPPGYSVTGCGIQELNRKWNKLSAFESVHSYKNGCSCDSGYGIGRNHCYARCCKVQTKIGTRRVRTSKKVRTSHMKRVKSIHHKRVKTAHYHTHFTTHHRLVKKKSVAEPAELQMTKGKITTVCKKKCHLVTVCKTGMSHKQKLMGTQAKMQAGTQAKMRAVYKKAMEQGHKKKASMHKQKKATMVKKKKKSNQTKKKSAAAVATVTAMKTTVQVPTSVKAHAEKHTPFMKKHKAKQAKKNESSQKTHKGMKHKTTDATDSWLSASTKKHPQHKHNPVLNDKAMVKAITQEHEADKPDDSVDETQEHKVDKSHEEASKPNADSIAAAVAIAEEEEARKKKAMKASSTNERAQKRNPFTRVKPSNGAPTSAKARSRERAHKRNPFRL